MEEENFDAKLAKLAHDIEQLDGKIEDKISSLREDLRKSILEVYLTQARDASIIYLDIPAALNPAVSEACKRVRDELVKLSEEYFETLEQLSADEFQRELEKFKARINTLTRSAGLGQIWKT